MSGIGGKNTLPERKLRSALHAKGLRFRLHRSNLPGRPDIVLPGHRAVLMVHGCFWHRHTGCRYATTPATRAEFWSAKFAENMTRDRRNLTDLRAAGWRVKVVWECEIRKDVGACAEKVVKWLRPNLSNAIRKQ